MHDLQHRRHQLCSQQQAQRDGQRQHPLAHRHMGDRMVDQVGRGLRHAPRAAAIARALHQRPTLLLADEPTASLDADAADEVIGLLAEVAAERGATLVCVVHDLDLLPRLADRAIALRHGVVVADVAVTPHTPGQLRGMLK